jgi:hypothetical protein
MKWLVPLFIVPYPPKSVLFGVLIFFRQQNYEVFLIFAFDHDRGDSDAIASTRHKPAFEMPAGLQQQEPECGGGWRSLFCPAKSTGPRNDDEQNLA